MKKETKETLNNLVKIIVSPYGLYSITKELTQKNIGCKKTGGLLFALFVTFIVFIIEFVLIYNFLTESTYEKEEKRQKIISECKVNKDYDCLTENLTLSGLNRINFPNKKTKQLYISIKKGLIRRKTIKKYSFDTEIDCRFNLKRDHEVVSIEKVFITLEKPNWKTGKAKLNCKIGFVGKNYFNAKIYSSKIYSWTVKLVDLTTFYNE